jgi:hypothetical protein
MSPVEIHPIGSEASGVTAPGSDATAWTPWFGGDCPVPPETPVQIRLGIEESFDEQQPARRAETWRWDHGKRCHLANITHYRVMPA